MNRMWRKPKLIVTLGPATNTEAALRKLKDKGVDFVRVNMSHSSLDDLQRSIDLSKKVGIPFIIDTEGSQVRSGRVRTGSLELREGDDLRILTREVMGDQQGISLHPSHVVEQLEEGDLLYVDFESLILRVLDTSSSSKGHIRAKALTSGSLGSNKAVAIEASGDRRLALPPLSEKDYQSIEIGLAANVEDIAVSFVRGGASVDAVRQATQSRMRIISKIECTDALQRLDEIIEASDALLLDRGDLSKEIPIEKVPIAQKIVLGRAARMGKDVFVATNLLETMVAKNRPTRAEVHDVIATLLDGASGVILSAETAIGRFPMECVSMMNKLFEQVRAVDAQRILEGIEQVPGAKQPRDIRYLLDDASGSTLVAPHGGILVDRLVGEPAGGSAQLDSLQKIVLNANQLMDLEQIAIGTFSPLDGFMTESELGGVLDDMRLPSGVLWTVPLVLDVDKETADQIASGDTVALADDEGIVGTLDVSDSYLFDRERFCDKIYGTTDTAHPGVAWALALQPFFLGGRISLFRRSISDHRGYELTPRQVRRLFSERMWTKVVGFHTRNVIHRSHEYIQLAALEKEHCDGLFVHPVIGKKRSGDFRNEYIVKSYEYMVQHCYPKDKVVFATLSTFSRYAGPREAVFTAICRKNFGCTHFIVGRDHTGAGTSYDPHASHEIFDRFPDLGIEVVKFDSVFYSRKHGAHMEEDGTLHHADNEKLHISGSEARSRFQRGEAPPDWFMRPEIARMVLDAIEAGEEVFVE